MNREKEIEERASEYAQYEVFGSSYDDVWIGFVDGAKYADEHPSFPLIVKIWNLATKTTIAQVNNEMPYFQSEKEIEEFIIKKLKL